MCILILRVVVSKILSVALSLHACREQVGGVRTHRSTGVRGGDQEVQGGDPCIGGSPTATN